MKTSTICFIGAGVAAAAGAAIWYLYSQGKAVAAPSEGSSSYEDVSPTEQGSGAPSGTYDVVGGSSQGPSRSDKATIANAIDAGALKRNYLNWAMQ